ADVTIEWDEDSSPANTGSSTATDNCDSAPVVDYTDNVIPSTVCPQEYTIERTWTATDACGNSSTCLQVITVDDSTAPVLACAADVTIECDEGTSPANTGTSTATDNCDTAPAVDSADKTIPSDCSPQYSTNDPTIARA